MNSILIPNPNKIRALIIVDMQTGFLPERTRYIIKNVQSVIQKGNYNLYVEAVFHADTGSLWDIQTNWTFKIEPTIPEIKSELENKNTILVTKTTKSAFQGDKDLITLFKENNIQEVHIVGVDANDCVMATAFDSFDAGFFTYVLEECVESSEGIAMRESALAILRNVELTNHSEYIKDFGEIELN